MKTIRIFLALAIFASLFSSCTKQMIEQKSKSVTPPATKQTVVVDTFNVVVLDGGVYQTGTNSYYFTSDSSINLAAPFTFDSTVKCYIQFIDLGKGDTVLYGSAVVPYAGVQPDWSAMASSDQWPISVSAWVSSVLNEVTGMAPLPSGSNIGEFTGYTYGLDPDGIYSDTERSIAIGNSFNGAPNLDFGSVSQFGVKVFFTKEISL